MGPDADAPAPPEPAPAEAPPTAPVPAGDPAASALYRAAEELAAAQRAAAERAEARRAARRAQRPAAPTHGEPVKPRIVARESRTPTPWLTTAIERIAATDQHTASRLLVQLLPAQGPAFDRPLTYSVAIEGDGTFRVEITADGVARLEREPGSADALVDIRLAGPAEALAPLAGGGAQRKLPNVTTEGRWLRVRRLLKARRTPLTLADLVELDIPVEPRLILQAAAAGIERDWTSGQRFAVDVRVEDPPAPPSIHRVVVADAAPVSIVDDPPPGHRADATVIVTKRALLPLLARLAPPPGEGASVSGDGSCFAQLLRWTDRLQGIPERD